MRIHILLRRAATLLTLGILATLLLAALTPALAEASPAIPIGTATQADGNQGNSNNPSNPSSPGGGQVPQGGGGQNGQGGQANSSSSGTPKFLDGKDFNIFGSANKELMSTGIGHWLAGLVVRVLVILFDVALVVGVAVLFVKLALVLMGRGGRETVMGHVTNMVFAIAGIVLILTGGIAVLINYLLQGANTVTQQVSLQRPPAISASVDSAQHG